MVSTWENGAVAAFERDGFLALEGVLSPEEVEEAKRELSSMCHDLRLEKTILSNAYGEVWRAKNSALMVQFERGKEALREDDPELELRVRKFHDFVGVAPHLSFLAQQQARIQEILSAILGARPVLLQNMALVKPPGGVAKPPHQDDAYFKIAPLNAVCGVWIALDEASQGNGCMHVWPGEHHEALRHFHGSDCEIVRDRLKTEDAVPVPLHAGGALFFSGLLPHHTPVNTSSQRRRALQFHYRSATSRLISDEEYDQLFVERDGTPASCSAAAKRGF